jgi:hypothetical protein
MAFVECMVMFFRIVADWFSKRFRWRKRLYKPEVLEAVPFMAATFDMTYDHYQDLIGDMAPREPLVVKPSFTLEDLIRIGSESDDNLTLIERDRITRG